MFPKKSAKNIKKQVGLKYLMFTENNTDVKIRMQKYATNIRKSYEISNLSQKHEQCFIEHERRTKAWKVWKVSLARRNRRPRL